MVASFDLRLGVPIRRGIATGFLRFGVAPLMGMARAMWGQASPRVQVEQRPCLQ